MGKNNIDVWEERIMIYNRDHGICRHCHKAVGMNDFEVAHRIANVVWARKKYGDEIIDHSLNKATTHRGTCNSGMLITFNPVETEKLIDEILAAIDKGER